MKAKIRAEKLRSHNKRRRGFSLTEVAIVLGVVGLLLGAIWVAAAAVYNNLRISHTNTQVMQIAQAIRTLYSAQNTISAGPLTPDLILANAVPEDMVNGTNLVDAWGGHMWVQGTSDNVGFVIEIDRVPQASCINLVTAVGGVARDPGLFMATAVTSSGSEITADKSQQPLLDTPTPTLQGTGCPQDSGTLATVEFGFSLKG